MRIGIPRESTPGERRVATTPDAVPKLMTLGFTVVVEPGAGQGAGFTDAAYTEAGATVESAAWSADVVVSLHAPSDTELSRMRPGAVLIALLGPRDDPDGLARYATAGLTAVALDAIPRISRAQSCDVLSSMANIAGYRAIIEASSLYGGFMGAQMTAAGKVPPARVLVIGAGVAGLAAIGAARGQGAEVRAFDTRPVVKEQVESLGGRFLMLDFDEDGTGTGGYAKVMSEAFIDAEMALFREQAAEVDIVITTALIPGRTAPILWTEDMVQAMRPGSVVVDLAARNGGNCALTVPGEVVVRHGVHIVGHTDLTNRLPGVASRFFAQNVVNYLKIAGFQQGLAAWEPDLDDPVVRDALVAHSGAVLWPPPERPPPEAPKRTAAPVHSVAPPKPRDGSGGTWLAVGALAAVIVISGLFAPREVTSQLTVFVLACFAGWQLVWAVKPALHTPLMAVTNAISGIIIVGGMFQVQQSRSSVVLGLALAAIVLASINIAGGFLVTQRMLRMFQRS